jgi:1-acyl-sn-glycerol-3-phosphate acyltransferase
MSMLINSAIVVGALLVLFILEFSLVLEYIFAPRSQKNALCSRYEQYGAKLLFGLFRVFRGFHVDIRNPRNLHIPKHCLVIANHQSLLDILVLIYMLGLERMPRFVAKKELQFGIPLVSFTLRKGGHCLIKRRGAPIDTMRSISKMARSCKLEQASCVVFPEGTRSRNGRLGMFHAAGVRKILETEAVPVAAIAIDGGWRVATLRDFLRRFGKEPYVVEIVEVYEAPRGKHEIEKVLKDAYEKIMISIENIRSSAGQPG